MPPICPEGSLFQQLAFVNMQKESPQVQTQANYETDPSRPLIWQEPGLVGYQEEENCLPGYMGGLN